MFFTSQCSIGNGITFTFSGLDDKTFDSSFYLVNKHIRVEELNQRWMA